MSSRLALKTRRSLGLDDGVGRDEIGAESGALGHRADGTDNAKSATWLATSVPAEVSV